MRKSGKPALGVNSGGSTAAHEYGSGTKRTTSDVRLESAIVRISLEPFHCRQRCSSISKSSLRLIGAKDDMEIARRRRQPVRPLRRMCGLFMLDGDRERTVGVSLEARGSIADRVAVDGIAREEEHAVQFLLIHRQGPERVDLRNAGREAQPISMCTIERP